MLHMQVSCHGLVHKQQEAYMGGLVSYQSHCLAHMMHTDGSCHRSVDMVGVGVVDDVIIL